MYLKTLLCLVCVTVVCTAKKPVTKDNCEVCVTVVEKFEKTLSDEDRKDSTKLEKLFMDFCKGLRSKEERFCYYIGGLKTSATYILGTMSKPLKSFLPTLKICEKLRDVDSQICDLKYEKQIDLTKVDLKKLKVKDLKKILSDWGEDNACKGCAEKSDFVRKVEELMPRYAPEAAKQREEL
ncbi:mesencephalic astrocyte-derived neurotrophic factor homolog [Ostrea edulis]|uniref:mesencephalic astrocyte-derived neurotrophic factor homolog n=1 Tax=Ostrea edulis TaxID=37623 RepID=UPI0020961AEA|nr:mesencephalic astrocyte-derived neurotrophic factor homolog [Ostrea edulis]